MDDYALTPAERALLRALNERGVRFLIVGMGAALLEGAPVSTQDLDLWLERIDDPRVPLAARDAGGFWIPQFGMQPPNLEPFDEEYRNAVVRDLDGITVRVLPLPRVIASKRAANRLKDQAALPALEATLLARRASDPESRDR